MLIMRTVKAIMMVKVKLTFVDLDLVMAKGIIEYDCKTSKYY